MSDYGPLVDIKRWLETVVAGTTPRIRTADPFRLTELSVPLDKAPTLGQTRTFEFISGARDRTTASITDAVEWWTDIELRVAYLGAQNDYALQELKDADISRIDQAIVQACFLGQNLPTGLNDVDFRGVAEVLKKTQGANHQVIRRTYRVRYAEPALS